MRRYVPFWLSRRLGFEQGLVQEDPADDRGLIARSLSFLFLSGATVSVLWLLLPHSAASNDAGVLAMTVGAYVMGIALFAGYDQIGRAHV